MTNCHILSISRDCVSSTYGNYWLSLDLADWLKNDNFMNLTHHMNWNFGECALIPKLFISYLELTFRLELRLVLLNNFVQTGERPWSNARIFLVTDHCKCFAFTLITYMQVSFKNSYTYLEGQLLYPRIFPSSHFPHFPPKFASGPTA